MQQQGGSQYGGPPQEIVVHFSSAGLGPRQPRMIGIQGGNDHLQNQLVVEAASPISSRPSPQTVITGSRPPVSFFDELGGDCSGSVKRNFVDEEEGERGGGGGNRWPRQETLALLKIRSEMDVAFRDVTIKSPLWEDVSRRMAELGYTRSAKKCKEKFENVHKYYKRTKEGRAGRQDGKCYRFFSQLEALHNTANDAIAGNVASFSTSPNINSIPDDVILHKDPAITAQHVQPSPLSQPPPPPPLLQFTSLEPSAMLPGLAGTGISFSSSTSSSSSSDGEDTDDGDACGLQESSRKRKREWWPARSGKTMAFFESLMKQLLERQEAMQQRFLDTIEKREQDRMVREEAWKRQEMARLNREYELMAQERTMAANRDAAVISFLQKYSGSISHPSNLPAEAAAINGPPVASNLSQERSSPQQPPEAAAAESAATQPESQINRQCNEIVIHQPAATIATSIADMTPVIFSCGSVDAASPSTSPSSRWPKTEVLALIKLRSSLETRYMEAGPKGPLWEEISMGMKRLGYNRSTKRCKEKWENINKYFKKVKEGNKKRSEDAKTCPYFHELDVLYRRKQHQESAPEISAPAISGPTDLESNNVDDKHISSSISHGGNHDGSSFHVPGNNAVGLSQVFFGGVSNGGNGYTLKKSEDIVKELIKHQNHEKDDVDLDGDGDDDDDDYDDDDDEDSKMRYEIQFQRQSLGNAGGPHVGNATRKAMAQAPPSSNAGSFLALVQ